MTVKHSEWKLQVRKALADKGINLQFVAEQTGYSYSIVAALVSGNTVKKNYLEVAEAINRILEIEDLPEKPESLPSEEWCMNVRMAMLKLQMSVSELSQKTGFSRDRVSLVINGRHTDTPVIEAINSLLSISVPALAAVSTE